MSLQSALLRLRAVFRRDSVERDLNDEVDSHIEMEAAAGVRRGLSPEAARREAILKFGGVERYKEEARDTRGVRPYEELRQDTRLAFRLLRKNPGFTAAAVATLALGIGANAAIFSVFDAVLLDASPFAAPDELVVVWETDRNSQTVHEPSSWPDIVDFRERTRTLESIGALAGYESTLALPDADPERVAALGVTPNLFRLLGIHPVAGRLFAGDDGEFGGPQVVLLAEDYWRGRFDADPAVVGSTITLNELPTTVVGVVPADADLGVAQISARADYSSPLSGSQVDLYIAFEPTAEAYSRSTHPFIAVGRLVDGVGIDAAQGELAAIAADLEATYPVNEARGVNLEPLSDVTFGAVRPVLLVLLVAVGLVLLVTCANVANLLLARTAARTREVAVRRALGAAGGRIGRQFLVENAVLTVLGAAAGLGVAYLGLDALIALAPADIPRLAAAGLDGRVLAFTLAVCTLVALGFGLVPALQARRLDIQDALKAQAGRSVSEGRGGRRFRSILVVAEVALAVTLVVGAALLLRSLQALRAVDPGFRTEQVLKAQYDLPQTRYRIDFSRWPDLPEITNLHFAFLREVRALPGVESAALATPHPLDAGFTNSFQIVGREAESQDFPEIRTRFVTPGYLRTLDVPLLRGRALDSGDVVGEATVAMINETAAERYFADAEPIGQQIRFWGTNWQIVGVIGDERFHGVDAPTDPAAYVPLAQAPQGYASLLVRTERGDPLALAPAIRDRLAELDPQLALYGVETLQTTLSASIARPRFTATLLALFAAVAIVLALIGVHGVLSYTMATRAPEVGIRLALGASRAQVLRLVVGEGIWLATLGVAIGLIGALAGGRLLASLLFGVSSTDPVTFALVAALVVATAAFASWLPARRAARIDPMRSLRAE